MPRMLLIVVLGLAGLASACSAPTLSSAGSQPESASPTPTASASVSPASSPRPPSPPSGFPAFPGAAVASPPTDDPGVVARWTTTTLGSSVFDFYQRELPRAGYRVLGLFPGGGGAVIRFEAEGNAWQVVIVDLGDQMQINLQTDRP
jgi:hypothetical protein